MKVIGGGILGTSPSPKKVADLDLWLRADSGVATVGARQFTATDSAYFTLATAPDPGTQDFAFEAFVYIDSLASYRTILVTGATADGVDGLRIAVDASGDVYVAINDAVEATMASKTFTCGLTASRWYHLLLNFDRDGNCELFIDDASKGTLDISSHTDSLGSTVKYIGTHDGASHFWDGRLSRIRWYEGRALTAAERSWLYGAGNGRTASEVAAHSTLGSVVVHGWDCFEGDGSADLVDSVGSNNATPTFGELVTNGTFDSDLSGWTLYQNGGTIDWDSGTIKLTEPPGSSVWMHAYQAITLVNGNEYAYSAQLTATDGNYNRFTGSNSAPSGNLPSREQWDSGYLGSPQTISGVFTSSTATAYLSLDQASSASDYGNWDNVSLKATKIYPANGPAVATAEDSSGNGNHGRLEGFSASQLIEAWKSDVPAAIGSGYSLEFDGTDDYVDCGNDATLQISGSLTISCQVRHIGGNYIVSKYAYNLYTAGLAPYFETRKSDDSGWDISATGPPITDQGWTHVAGVFDASADTKTAYTNGVAGSPVEKSDGSCGGLGAQPLNLGRFTVDPPQYFDGGVDDVRIYNRALSVTEIQTLASGGDVSNGLVGHWKFDDGPQSVPIADGDPIVQWEDKDSSRYQFTQTTAAKRPSYEAVVANSRPAVQADGSDDILVADSAVTGTAGFLCAAVKTGASLAAEQAIAAVSDEATTDNYWLFGIDAAGKLFVEADDGGTVHRVTGDTVLSTSTTYILEVASDGASWSLTVDGEAETLTVTGSNSGKMPGDITGTDNTTIAGLKSTSEQKQAELSLLELVYYSQAKTGSQRTYIRRVLAKRYGVSV